MSKKLPSFAHPSVARDFIHINDVVAAFVDAAIFMSPKIAGESFNIGTGVQTTLSSLANLTKKIFDIQNEPQFNLKNGRAWDVDHWYANPE